VRHTDAYVKALSISNNSQATDTDTPLSNMGVCGGGDTLESRPAQINDHDKKANTFIGGCYTIRVVNVANQSQCCLSHSPQSLLKQYHALTTAPTVPGATSLTGTTQNTRHNNRSNRDQQQLTPSHGTLAKNFALHAGIVLGAGSCGNTHHTPHVGKIQPITGLQGATRAGHIFR
jgi:hypothetical protein